MSKSGNLAALSAILSPGETPTIYYAEDPPYLPRILVFYYPVQAVGSLASTSRIRTTILSAAGFKSYGAFSVAPNSSYYSAVHKLPEDKQRDDVSRGIAFALCRYFSEVPTEVKNAIAEENLHHGIALKWGQTHAAQVTCRMCKVINTEEIVEALRPFSKERPASPQTPTRPLASIRKTRPSFLPTETGSHNVGRVNHAFTPSRRIPSGHAKRSPSISTPAARKASSTLDPKYSVQQLELLRFKMCEFVDTEDRYITRLQELIELVTNQGRTPKSLSSKFSSSRNQKAVNAMIQFPSLLDQIKDLNLAFLDDVETALHCSEDAALTFLDSAQANPQLLTNAKDPMGIYSFAKVLLNHFPKFPMPYRQYLDLHSQVSSNLDQFLKEGTTSIQRAPSLLMEPAQRISRYGLYIDTMLPHVPSNFTVAIRTLEKARKIIAEICEMEPAASTILDSLRIEHEAKKKGLSPTKLLSGLTRSNGTIREAPALTGSVREREGPRLFPSLGRSLSRRQKTPRPGLSGILSEQDPEQVTNVQSRTDENRPLTSSSVLSFGSVKRPPTSGSSVSATNRSTASASPGPNAPALLLSSKKRIGTAPAPSTVTGNIMAATARDGVQMPTCSQVGGVETVEHYKAQLVRVEEENYKLLQENAELKRLIRECTCGGTGRRL
ncbi:RhoGEF domain-containing protein [Cladophialophora immunda]|nr:RhoGEF domain-containing protein [Cladophialophora immunda]